MIGREADDFIRRIEHLEKNQLKAQSVKIRRREDRIRVIGSDRLYTHSPEEIVIDKLEREKIGNAEKRVLDSLSKRSRKFYFLREQGLLHREIADICKIGKRTVGMDLQKTIKKLQ